MSNKVSYKIVLFTLVAVQIGCATYYTKSKNTELAILDYNYIKAEQKIESNRYLGKKRNALLYYLEMAKINHLKGDYKKSIVNFQYADFLMDQYNSVADIAVGMAINPAMQPYRTEPHEQILSHYYNALNYLYLNNTEEAVVEARKINLREQALLVSAKGKETKYSQDPFGLMLMGMIYESDNDYNNAFIAYRNAYEAYNNTEIEAFCNMPSYLVSDLIRVSKLAGIPHQLKDHEVNKINSTKGEGGELILFWENGLVPVKMEKNLFFTLIKSKESGLYIFMDSEHLIQIPVDYDFESNSSNFEPSDLGIIRLAYAYYVDRVPQIRSAKLTANEESISLQRGESVGQLAFQIERDNYFKKLAKRLLRLAIKKLAEIKISKENEYLGLAVGITNAATEKADTRNWQSLPNDIHYARIPLKKGVNKIELKTDQDTSISIEVEGNGGMVFRNIATH